MVKAGLVGALFNMYVHVQHFSSIIGITEGANTCMEARRIEHKLRESVMAWSSRLRVFDAHTRINKGKKERKKNSDMIIGPSEIESTFFFLLLSYCWRARRKPDDLKSSDIQ